MKYSEHIVHRTGYIFILLAGIVTEGLGLLVLFGWALQFPFLTSFGANLIPMAPSTALLFILMGIALSLRSHMPQSSGMYFLSLFIGLLVTLMGLIFFFSSLAGIYSHIEYLGFSISDSLQGVSLGHMSPATAICFVACALAFLLTLSQSLERSNRAWIALVLAFLVSLTFLLFLIAYLLVSPLMYGSGVIPPSLPTSLAFLILSLGLFMSAGLQVWSYDRIKNAATARVSYVLLLIFVLLASGIVTGGYFAYRNYEKNYRNEIENQLSAVADLKVDQIEVWRKERLGDGQLFYKNALFSASVKRYIQNKNDRDAKADILTWIGKVQNAYSYDLMMLLNAQLNTVLVFPENKERTRLVIDQRNIETLLSGNIAFQDFYRNDQDQRVYLKILVPILDDRSPKRLIAVLALRINPETYLYPLIKKWPAPNRTSETLIIRRDGNDALFLNDLKYRKDAALNLRIPLTSKDVPAVRAVLGQTGIVEGVDYRGVQVIANIRTIPDSPWFLIARMDMDEVYAPLKERLWLMIILVGALFVGAGTGVGFVWHQQRSRFYQQQYKSAEALRTSNERLQMALESANSGAWEWDLLTNENIWSDDLWILYGLEPHSCVPSYETWRQTIHPDDRESATLKVQEAALKGSELNAEWRVIDRDGSVRWLMSRGRPLRDANGIAVRFMGIVLDITDRKRAEEALRASGEKFRAIFENNSSAIAIIERDTTIFMVNDAYCQMSGYTKEEVIGMSWTQQIPPEDLERLKEYNRRRLINPDNAPDKYEFKFYKKSGEIRHGLMFVSLLQSTRQIITSFVDITDRRNAEEERENIINELKAALNDVKILSGLLPICSSCKKIRDDNGYWQQVEGYIQQHSDAKFTHGMCPDCMVKFYPEYMKDKEKRLKKK